ncbi:MAG: amino acid ABC transporter substrate-binding protein, partial [Desulfobacteraceae bacterium]
MKKIFWVVIALFCFSTFFILFPLSSAARPIKVGVIDCYSGPAAMFCKEALNGFKL